MITVPNGRRAVSCLSFRPAGPPLPGTIDLTMYQPVPEGPGLAPVIPLRLRARPRPVPPYGGGERAPRGGATVIRLRVRAA